VQWRFTVSDRQERPDIQQILGYKDQILEGDGDKASHQELNMLAPGLMTVTNSWRPKIDPRMDGLAIWGFARLVVQKVDPALHIFDAHATSVC